LKIFSTIAPLLIHANSSKPFILETNVFDFVINVVLSQLGGNKKKIHPIGFHFCKLAKINYKIHDKKLIAIMDAFEE
jgi:hypothetical protein